VVRDDELAAVRRIEEKGSDISVTVLEVEKGQLVKIPSGPFKGQTGIVDQVNKKNILIYIEQLGCQVRFKYGEG
jgi:transcription antitermination factor NusG